MGVTAMAWAWMQDAGTPGSKLVLMALADHANDDGVCWPGQATIARKAEMSTRAVRDNLERLVARGLVQVEERRRQDGSKASNLYVLTMRLGLLDPPADSSGGAEAGRTSHRKQASGHEPSIEPSEGTPSPKTPSSRKPILKPEEEPELFAQWLGFHVTAAGKMDVALSVPRAGTSYRSSLARTFGALAGEGYGKEDFELASLGVLSDDWMRSQGHVKPENVLRKEKIGGRIDVGRAFRAAGGEGGGKYGRFDD